MWPPRYFGMDGQPLDQDAALDLLGNIAARRVALDAVGDVEVSTVLLVLDHAWGGGPPVIFETMVFGGPLDHWCDRYSTREQALAGHAWACMLAHGNLAEGPATHVDGA